MSTHSNTDDYHSKVIERAREFRAAIERRRKDIAYQAKLLAKLRRIQAGEHASQEELRDVFCLLKELDWMECVERYGEDALTALYESGGGNIKHKSLCKQVDDQLCILREEENERIAKAVRDVASGVNSPLASRFE